MVYKKAAILFGTLILLFLLAGSVMAENDKEKNKKNETPKEYENPLILSSRMHYGWIFAHQRHVESVDGTEPAMLELDLGIRWNDVDTWNNCHCFPRVGIFFNYADFRKSFLGEAYSGGVYIQPYLANFSLLSPYMKAGASVSWMTKPYDIIENEMNHSYATHINFYLFLALGMNIHLSDKIDLSLGGYFNHMSNAGYKEPNGGINFPSLSAGLEYKLNDAKLQKKNTVSDYDLGHRETRHDISAHLGYASITFPDSGSYALYGVAYRYSHQVNRFGALVAGAELEINERGREKMLRGMFEPGLDHKRFSINGGYEFLMGRTLFSIVIGVYLYRPIKESEDLYQEYQLVQRFFENFALGVNLKSFRHVADNVSLRAIYSF